MAEIDVNDCTFEISVGDRTRRSLIRHFSEFVRQAIRDRGFNADDPELFDQDMIDGQAWRMAAEAIQRLKDYYDNVREVVGHDAIEIATEHFGEIIPEMGSRYLDDDLFGVGTLIELASGHFPEIR